MEFFYDLISKIKNSRVVLAFVIVLILVNDIFIIRILTKKENVESYSNSKKLDSIKMDEDNNNELKTTFKIDVKGQVKKPGVYEVSDDMNVNDAIMVAGGLTKKASTDNINLSKKLKDQMVIIVPKKITNSTITKVDDKSISKIVSNEEKRGENAQKSDIDNSISSLSGDESIESTIVNDALIQDSDIKEILIDDNSENENKLISINYATVEQLMNLPGIGLSKAKAIIEYRKNNSFLNIEDIKNVSGIGDSLFEKIKDFITV